MRGQTFSSYALVAFAITAYAAPLVATSDDVLEARQPYVLPGKVGVVAVGQEFERRQASTKASAKASATQASAQAPAKASTKASATEKPATGASASKPAAGGAKATTPADLPGW